MNSFTWFALSFIGSHRDICANSRLAPVPQLISCFDSPRRCPNSLGAIRSRPAICCVVCGECTWIACAKGCPIPQRRGERELSGYRLRHEILLSHLGDAVAIQIAKLSVNNKSWTSTDNNVNNNSPTDRQRETTHTCEFCWFRESHKLALKYFYTHDSSSDASVVVNNKIIKFSKLYAA